MAMSGTHLDFEVSGSGNYADDVLWPIVASRVQVYGEADEEVAYTAYCESEVPPELKRLIEFLETAGEFGIDEGEMFRLVQNGASNDIINDLVDIVQAAIDDEDEDEDDDEDEDEDEDARARAAAAAAYRVGLDALRLAGE